MLDIWSFFCCCEAISYLSSSVACRDVKSGIRYTAKIFDVRESPVLLNFENVLKSDMHTKKILLHIIKMPHSWRDYRQIYK